MAIWFDIEARSGIPIFKQIIDQVRQAIGTGVIKTDERLPTVRELAEEHSINPNTVAKAYQELERTGLVYTKPGVRGGTFVAASVEQNLREVEMEKFQENIRKVVRDGHLLGLEADEVTRRFQEELNVYYKTYPLPEPSRIELNFGTTSLASRSAEKLYTKEERR